MDLLTNASCMICVSSNDMSILVPIGMQKPNAVQVLGLSVLTADCRPHHKTILGLVRKKSKPTVCLHCLQHRNMRTSHALTQALYSLINILA